MDPATVRHATVLAGTLARSRLLRVVLIVVLVVALVLAWVWLWGPAAFSSVIATQRLIRQQQALQAASVSCAEPLAGTGTSVAVPSLSRDQVAIAHTIWRVAHQSGLGDRGAIVGIATAYQESSLGADATIRRPNADGDVAVFQQRALLGWYAPGASVEDNVRVLLDPATAARTFFTGHTITPRAHAAAVAAGTTPAGPVGYHIPGLADIPGWQALPITLAAQKVQRSAFPEAYARHESLAATLVQRFAVESGNPAVAANLASAGQVTNPGLCDNGNAEAANCADSGLAVERALTPDAVRVLRCIRAQFPHIRSFGGVGDRPANVDDDHQTGRAVDIMIPGRCDPVGSQVRDYVMAHRQQLGVKYIIWCDQIWSVARHREGWRPYANPGGATDTLAHRDHVHVSVYGNAAGAQVASAASAATGNTVAPVSAYTLTARFGQCSALWVACHTGLDFAASEGTPIRAARDGTVVFVGWHNAYGNLTKLDHGGGITTWYAHQSAVGVRMGDRVTAGQVIGRVGNTGNSRGAHLHFEIRQGGAPINPHSWLRAQGVNP